MQTVSFVLEKNMAADNVIENQEYLSHTIAETGLIFSSGLSETLAVMEKTETNIA